LPKDRRIGSPRQWLAIYQPLESWSAPFEWHTVLYKG
jgi:hypothetical protein